MRIAILFLFIYLFSYSCFSQVRVRGYFRKNGTYVQPHYRSLPDGNPYNNYSYPGNINPYTGKVAPGSPSVYLKNYKNQNIGGYIQNRYYEANAYALLNTNYGFVGRFANRSSYYKIQERSGTYWGNLESLNNKLYGIYDDKSVLVGYVKFKNNGNYEIYDSDNLIVRHFQNKIDLHYVTWAIIFIGLLFVVNP
jgi:hypothetical protein